MDNLYNTADRSFILAVLTAGYNIHHSETKMGAPGVVLFYFDREQSVSLPDKGNVSFQEFYEIWLMGSTSLPIPDIRKLITALDTFNFTVKEKHFARK